MQIGTNGIEQREFQVRILEKIARPVLEAAANDWLSYQIANIAPWKPTAASEALIRTLAGIAPWLELGPDKSQEGILREELAELARNGVKNLVDPNSADHVALDKVKQNLVEVGHLAQSMLRSPKELWNKLDRVTKERLIQTWKNSRKIFPSENNWVTFSSIIEAALQKFHNRSDYAPIKRAIQFTNKWYLGEGLYKDGHHLKMDYYNSYVLTPMLWETLDICHEFWPHNHAGLRKTIKARAMRQAEIQENLISPEGTFPVMGRSSTYRFAAFHTLGLCALKNNLPEHLSLGGTRNAMTQVIANTTREESFDADGWLLPGMVAHQPKMRDFYINTGSLYLCCLGFAPLGLPANHPFWTENNCDWTQKRIWNGEDMSIATHLHEPKMTDKLRPRLGRIHEIFRDIFGNYGKCPRKTGHEIT